MVNKRLILQVRSIREVVRLSLWRGGHRGPAAARDPPRAKAPTDHACEAPDIPSEASESSSCPGLSTLSGDTETGMGIDREDGKRTGNPINANL
jgi:hypothetical protein